MTIKKNLETEGTDTRWRNKGTAHIVKRRLPKICPACNGIGMVGKHNCNVCQGTGEIE